MTTTRAGVIIEKAVAIVNGDRNTQHGNKERSFECIADFWSRYLTHRNQLTVLVTPRDVAQLMVLMKMARSLYGQPLEDHYVDEVGYAGIAGELSELETRDELLDKPDGGSCRVNAPDGDRSGWNSPIPAGG